MLDRTELERKAEEVRSHLLSTAEELERISSHRLDGENGASGRSGDDARYGASDGATPSAASGEASTGVSGAVSPERKRLERRADRVREHLIDSVEALEQKARERILPIVVTGTAVLALLTVGFAWMFYKTVKRG
jgi:hypothetical protein